MRTSLRTVIVFVLALGASAPHVFGQALSCRVLATTKTSTMQKEMQEAGEAGFRFVGRVRWPIPQAGRAQP